MSTYIDRTVEQYKKLNPHEEFSNRAKSKVTFSIVRLFFLPSKMFPYWPAALVTVIYFFFAYFDNLTAIFNGGVSINLPIISTFWVGIVWGFYAFALSNVFSISQQNNINGRNAYNNAVGNNAGSFCATVSGDAKGEKRSVYELGVRMINFMYMYNFAIKIVSRGVEIKIDKLPGLLEDKKLLLKNINTQVVFNNEKVSSKISKFDQALLKKNRKYDNKKGNVVTSNIYNVLLQLLDNYRSSKKLDGGVNKTLLDFLSSIDSGIDVIASGSISSLSNGLKEVVFLVSIVSLSLLSITYFQMSGILLGYFFILFSGYLIIGIPMYSMKTNNPFDDPDENPYISFGSSVSLISNNIAQTIGQHRSSLIKSFNDIKCNDYSDCE